LEDTSTEVNQPKTIVEVSKTCLDGKKFRTYVLRILQSLVSQLPDNTLLSVVKRFFGFTRQLSAAASRQLQSYTEFKNNLKGQLSQVRDGLRNISTLRNESKKYACTSYEVLKYIEGNKRKITAKNLIRFLNALFTVILQELSDPNTMLQKMEEICVKYLRDILSRQKELSPTSLDTLNEILKLSGQPEITLDTIERIGLEELNQFDLLAEGMRSLARRSRKKKGRRTSKSKGGKHVINSRRKKNPFTNRNIIKSI
jgi:hypothetical protein